MSDFKLNRDRDAWATIRGYVYQIDLSIRRWLTLQDSQILELERGEDIDLTNQLVSPDCPDPERILEQIKHREGSITLRSPEARYAMACFYEHRASNPGSKLTFRFVTNAAIGQEKPSLFRNKEPGISLWRKCAANTLADAERQEFLAQARAIIEHADKPQELEQVSWNKFKAHISTDTNLLELISDFEWSTGETSAPALTDTIVQEIVLHGHASDKQIAEELYHRLFLYVAKLLSTRGVKQLTTAARTSVIQAQNTVLQDRDSKLLTSIKSIIDLAARDLHHQVDAAVQDVAVLHKKLEDLTASYGFASLHSLSYGPPNIGVPDVPGKYVPRSNTVANLITLLKQSIWLIIIGGTATGKTSLGVLVSQKHGDLAVWFRLQASAGRLDQSVAILHAGLYGATGINITPDRGAWYLEVCRKIGSGRLIVLDDVPRFSPRDLLAEELRLLATACGKTGNYLLLFTSHPVLANSLSFGSGKFAYALEVPRFGYEEIKELALAYGAPTSWLADNYTGFLAGITDQHAAIVAAFVQYLAAHEWRLTKEAFDELMHKVPTVELVDTMVHELGATLTDAPLRDLLYRLTLYATSFSSEDAFALAMIQPEIAEPRRRFQDIIGPWVQKASDNEYIVSPLIRNLGSTELVVSVREAAHRIIGERLFRKKAHSLNQYNVSMIIGHFHQAKEHNRAGALLVWALTEIDKAEKNADSNMLVSLWPEVLPEEMELQIRIVVRVYQIKLRHSAGMSYQVQAAHLAKLCSQVTKDSAWATMIAVALIGKLLVEVLGVEQLLKLYAQGRRHLDPGAVPSEVYQSSLSLIWHYVGKIKDQKELAVWFEVVEALSPIERDGIKKSALYEDSALSMADHFWLREADKAPEDRHWDRVQGLLILLAERSRTLGLDILWTSAIRASIIVNAEYLHDMAAGATLAEEFLSGPIPDDPRIRFLIKECVGRNYAYINDREQARTWMLGAYQETFSHSIFSVIRMHFLLEAAEQHTGEPLSIEMAEQAVLLAKADPAIPETELVKALCGQSVAYFRANKRSESYEALDQAAVLLLATQPMDDGWKELFVRLGQIAGSLGHLAIFGAPAKTETGDEYPVPGISWSIRMAPALVAQYDPLKESYVLAQLATLGAGVQNHKRAADWAMKAVERAIATRQHMVITTAGRMGAVHMILNDRYPEALDLAFDSGKSMVICAELAPPKPGAKLNLGDGDRYLENWPDEKWLLAEKMAILSSVVPLFLRVAILAIDDLSTAVHKAKELERIFSELATRSRVPEVWQTLRRLLDFSLINPVHLRTLNDYIMEAMAKQPHSDMRDTIHIAAYVIASVSPSADLANAFKLNCMVLSSCLRDAATQTDVKDLLFHPFVEKRWRRALAEQRSHFSNPRLAERCLEEAEKQIGDDRILSVLEAISSGLALEPPTDINALRKKKPS